MRPPALSLVALALTLAACDATEAPVSVAAPVLPLEVGAEWALELVYIVSFDPVDASADTNRSATPFRVTLTVARDTLIDGERWYRLEASRAGGIDHPAFGRLDRVWYANRADGLYRLAAGGSPELLYAAASAPGVPFIDTPDQMVALDEDAASYDLPDGEPVTARAFTRTQRRFSGAGPLPGGPIEPTLSSSDYLSPEVGFVVLDVPFVRSGNEEGVWLPARVLRYALVSYDRP